MADEHSITRLRSGGFTVVGWEGRTTNAQEMTPNGVISKLWQRARSEGAFEQVRDRDGSDVVALYTNYESDKDGPYTYILGVKVNSDRNIPAGMVAHRVPSAEYALLAVRDHPAPTAVIGLWQQIWSLEQSHEITRAYHTDFESHHMKGATETAVELYVGIKK